MPIDSLSMVIVIANSVTLLAGGFVTVMAWRAYLRTGTTALAALTIGLGLVTVGTLIGGTLHQLLTTDLLTGIAVQSVFTAVGFLVLVYSLYRTQSSTTTSLSVTETQ